MTRSEHIQTVFPRLPAGLRPAALLAAACCVAALVTPASIRAQAPRADSATAERAADPAAVRELRAPDPRHFPVPAELGPNVLLWTKVYTEYDDDTVLLHDDRHLHVIYAAIDFSELNDSHMPEARKRLVKQQELRRVREKYEALLRTLAAGERDEDHAAELARLEQMFEGVPGGTGKYAAALGRIRTQTCLANRFAEGIERSGVYMPAIEEIFSRHRLPRELTRLPFVESLFQLNAHSSARAGGIWQFMPSTAQLYMETGAEFDDRFNPLRATEAAARLLADNYNALGTWPLALTAYNHGRGGMLRAVRQLGTRDMGVIAERYNGRTFGFASRNFYAEFIAAATVYENRDHYFPDVEPLPPLRVDEFVPRTYVSLHHLAAAAKTEVEHLRALNPALRREVWSGDLYLPAGYKLLVPEGHGGAFRTAFDQLPADHKSAQQVGSHYRVRPGDTLGIIARRFGTTVSALQRANGLRSPNLIHPGQVLRIPSATGARPRPASAPAAAAPATGVHVVRSGDTLIRIAGRYDTTVDALRAANGLGRGAVIHPGQRLKVPGARNARTTHVVRSGETLGAIARRYDTTVNALKAANKIRSHVIRPAQVLVIP